MSLCEDAKLYWSTAVKPTLSKLTEEVEGRDGECDPGKIEETLTGLRDLLEEFELLLWI